MTVGAYFVVALSIAIPIGWMAAEFRARRPIRILLGLLSIAVAVSWTYCLETTLGRLSYNAWYGAATHDLIDSSLKEVENGQLDRVLMVWRGLRTQYQPTYENRAHYDELVNEAVARIRGEARIVAGSNWDAAIFDGTTWAGHWENDTGFWLVINGFGPPFTIIRSGDPTPLQFISLSPDARLLTFREGDRWLHTLTLKSKYEASHQWLDARDQSVNQVEPICKLIRVTNEQKRFTEQTK